MEKRRVVARILAIAGAVLVWLPVLAPAVLYGIELVGRTAPRTGDFGPESRPANFDFLIPLELFPVVLAGGALLVAGALLARSRRRLVIASLAVAVALLVGSQLFAIVTGMASGRTEATGWRLAVGLAAAMGYVAAAAVLGVGGALLIRDTFRKPPTAAGG